MAQLKIGDTVVIAENDSLFDCCGGKRGRIVHVGVGGGWLVHTDHFCPVERSDDELTLVPVEQLAQEVIEENPARVVEVYRKTDTETLEESRERGDRLAWAVLIERAAPLPISNR